MGRPSKHAQLAISEFKKHCLALLEEVRKEGRELVITRRGIPIARVLPLSSSGQRLRGSWKGLIETPEDIVHIDWTEDWEAAR